MHTEQTANFSVRVAYDDLGITADDVVWMPSPVGHSTGFNYGLRFALYHGLPPGAAGPVGRRSRPLELVAQRGLLVHPGRHHVPPGPRRAVGRATGVRLDSLRRFGCGGAPGAAPARRRRRRACGITVLRLYGSTEVLVGTWNRPWSTPRPAAVHRRRAPCRASRCEVRDADGDARLRAGRAGRAGRPAARTPASGSSPTRSAPPPPSSPTVGCAAATPSPSTPTATSPSSAAPRRSSSAAASTSRPARSRSCSAASPRSSGPRWSACPTSGSASGCAPASCCGRAASLDLDDVVRTARAAGVATYKRPQRLEVLDALPATASGKIQKHEIVGRSARPRLVRRWRMTGLVELSRPPTRRRPRRRRRASITLNRPDQLNPIDIDHARRARRRPSTRSRRRPGSGRCW